MKKRLEEGQKQSYSQNAGKYIEEPNKVLKKNLDMVHRMTHKDKDNCCNDDLKPDRSESEGSDLSANVDKNLSKSNMMRLNKKRTNASVKAMKNLRSNYIKWYDNGEGQRR